MEATPYPKINIEVADCFYTDAEDLIDRFDRTFEVYFGVKSRRIKCYYDLRAAYECILKSIIAYHEQPEIERRDLIKKTERYGHKISELEVLAQNVDTDRESTVLSWGTILDRLPVGLRYALDAYDFIEAKESLYYETIGDDDWLYRLRKYVGTLSKAFGEKLSCHSGIISVRDIPMEKLLCKDYNKYS